MFLPYYNGLFLKYLDVNFLGAFMKSQTNSENPYWTGPHNFLFCHWSIIVPSLTKYRKATPQNIIGHGIMLIKFSGSKAAIPLSV